jgi:hypothetical protein
MKRRRGNEKREGKKYATLKTDQTQTAWNLIHSSTQCKAAGSVIS